MTEFKRSDYLAVAKELITIMGLKDDKGKPLPIDQKSNVTKLQEFIMDAAQEIDPEVDEFTDSTISVLKSLGYTGFGIEEEKTEETVKIPAPTKEEMDADGDIDDKDWEEPEPVSLKDKVAGAKKLADLKELCTANKEFKKLVPKLDDYQGLAGPRELKAKMQEIVGITTAPTIEKTENKKGLATSQKKAERYSRVTAAIDTVLAMKGGFTTEELINGCIKTYAEKTETVPVEAYQMSTFPKQLIEVLLAFGKLEEKNGKYFVI